MPRSCSEMQRPVALWPRPPKMSALRTVPLASTTMPMLTLLPKPSRTQLGKRFSATSMCWRMMGGESCGTGSIERAAAATDVGLAAGLAVGLVAGGLTSVPGLLAEGGVTASVAGLDVVRAACSAASPAGLAGALVPAVVGEGGAVEPRSAFALAVLGGDGSASTTGVGAPFPDGSGAIGCTVSSVRGGVGSRAAGCSGVVGATGPVAGCHISAPTPAPSATKPSAPITHQARLRSLSRTEPFAGAATAGSGSAVLLATCEGPSGGNVVAGFAGRGSGAAEADAGFFAWLGLALASGLLDFSGAAGWALACGFVEDALLDGECVALSFLVAPGRATTPGSLASGASDGSSASTASSSMLSPGMGAGRGVISGSLPEPDEGASEPLL